MSQGTLRLDDTSVYYELRMPLYEIDGVDDPEQALSAAFSVKSRGREPVSINGSCRENAAEAAYQCETTFTFDHAPKAVEVRCEYPSVTVANHVHVLQSGEGATARQTMLDVAQQRAEIRFVDPTPAEAFWEAFLGGVRRVVTSPALILFLVALVLAGRTRSELLAVIASFFVAEFAGAMLFRGLEWQAPPRFVEAAAALTVAYLAVEILLLPEAKQRWLVAGGMGSFHGLVFGSFLKQVPVSALSYLPGVLLCEVAILGLLAAGWGKIRSRRLEQLGAVLLLTVGLGWFVLRLVE